MTHRIIALSISASLLIGGCQHAPIDTGSGSAIALEPTSRYYPGNEVRPAWFRTYHRLYISSGKEFRGYSRHPRHWWYD